MEWEAPGIVLAARPFGEGDAVVSVFTEAHGRHQGLVRGATSRRQSALWQPANLMQLRWVGRLADQLGTFTGEPVHQAGALAMDDPLALSMLTAACAVAEGGLPERAPHPRAFTALLRLIAHLAEPQGALLDHVRWEAALLSDLGYGLDLTRCAITGQTHGLGFVSPRTGRAVCLQAAAEWRDRLLPLPRFLTGATTATLEDLRDGLRLTGHFLARSAFGHRNLPLPAPRLALYDRVVRMMFPDSPKSDSPESDSPKSDSPQSDLSESDQKDLPDA